MGHLVLALHLGQTQFSREKKSVIETSTAVYFF